MKNTATLLVALVLALVGSQQRSGPIIYQEGKRSMFTADKTVGNTVTQTSIIPTTQTMNSLQTLVLYPSGFVNSNIGTTIRIVARGYVSTKAAAPGTLTIAIKLGSTTVVTATSGTLVGNLSNEEWELDEIVTFRTLGAAGTVQAAGTFTFTNDLAGALGAVQVIPLVTTSPVTVAQNATLLFDAMATWSVADTANTMTTTVGGYIETDSL